MSDNKKQPLEVQTKAVLIHAPGVGYVVKTGDGQAIAITAGLALDLANQIIATEAGAGSFPVPSALTPLLQ